MMSSEAPLVLLLDAEPADHALHSRVTAAANQVGFRLLSERAESSAEAVLIAPRLCRSSSSFRLIRDFSPEVEVLFLVPEGDGAEVRRRLSFGGLAERRWDVVEENSMRLGERILEAARGTRQRRRHRTTLDRMNLKLAVPDLMDARRLRGLVLSDVQLRAILEQAEDAIVTLDSSGIVTSWNPAAESFLGRNSSEAIGRSVEALGDAAWLGWLGGGVRGAAPIKPSDLEIRRPDGRPCVLSLRLTPLNEGRAGFLLVGRDVTERRAGEDEVRRANETLEAKVADRTARLLQSNQELEAFCYSVSHDLRAPLRAMEGFSRILLESAGAAENPETRHCLDRINSAASRMAGLIDDLLELSRLSNIELVRVSTNLSQIVREISGELTSRDPGRAAGFEIESGLVASCDPRLIRVVLVNLLGNAWKFTSTRDRARIEFGSCAARGRRAYFVRDDGVGFNPEFSRRLFGAFQRLHKESEFPGTGVGLATVRRIVRRHGGDAWAEGIPTRGAVVYFTLEGGIVT